MEGETPTIRATNEAVLEILTEKDELFLWRNQVRAADIRMPRETKKNHRREVEFSHDPLRTERSDRQDGLKNGS